MRKGWASLLVLAFLVAGMVPFASANECSAPHTRISAIQGDDESSPMAGETLAVEGVITLDGRGPGGLAGFYLQSLPADRDRRASTSEGLFIYSDAGGGEVGDHVRVRGLIKEYHGLTEMATRGRVEVCGRVSTPEPVLLSFPLPDLEPLEGMRVAFAQSPIVIDTHDLGRYSVVELAAADPIRSRLRPESLEPRSRILLDDRRLVQNPESLPLPHPGLSAENSLRTGSHLGSVPGVLDYRYDRWRIQPETWPQVVASNARPAAPRPPREGAVRVAAFNTLNFFNGDGKGGDFPTARGADSVKELTRQRQKLVAAIQGLKADIVGLMELENDGSDENSAIAELTRALGPGWRYIRQPEAGNDAIRVGLIYRADRVAPAGAPAVLAHGVFSRYSRAPVAQDFRLNGDDDRLRVVVNHFKSRSCRNAWGNNRADDEGCYAPVRERSARELLAWLETLSKPEDLSGTVILGDLNTYVGERPLAILAGKGFRRPAELAGNVQHTYRFDGVRGVLDHMLPDERLQPRVIDGGVWHINADEPPILDYNLEFHPAGRAERLYGPGPWRSSDHDPVYLDVRTGRR